LRVKKNIFVTATLVLLFGLPIQCAWGAEFLKKQTGTVTISGTSVSVAIDAVCKNQSFLVFSATTDDDDPGDFHVGGEITDETTLTFYKVTTGSPSVTTIKWQVFEFASGVSVQHGSTAGVNGTDNITISAVTLANSFVIASGRKDGTTLGNDDGYTVDLTTTTNLQLIVAGGTYTEIYWQVIEYADATVQKVTGLLTDGGLPTATSALGTPVVEGKTMVISNHTIDTNIFPDDLPRTELTGPSTVTYTRDGTSGNLNFVTFVVEFTDNTVVERGLLAFPNNDVSEVVAIGNTSASSGVFGPGQFGRQGSTDRPTNSDNTGYVWFTYEITGINELTIERATSIGGDNAFAPYEIVTFEDANPANTTYYSLASGAWDANTSWSLTSDGSSGAVAAGVWPSRNDNVVIRSGHTIVVNAIDDNNACGVSPDNLNRTNVGAFTSSDQDMFYHTGDIIIDAGGTLDVILPIFVSGLMLEGFTYVNGTLTSTADIVNLGNLEVTTIGTFDSDDDIILSGNSFTIIDNTSEFADDIYIDHTDALLCGTGTIEVGQGGPDPEIQLINLATEAQICSSLTITCVGANCGAAPFVPPTGQGNYMLGYTGPGGVGAQSTNRIWLRPETDVYSDAGATVALDTDPVQQWNDQSGNGNHAVQNTSGNRPIYRTGQANNLPALEFTGDLFIDPPSLGISGNSDFTYFITFRDTQTTLGGINDGSGEYIFDRTTATNPLVSLKPVTGSFYGFQKRDDGGTGLGGPVSTSSISTNIKWIELFRDNGTSYDLYYNGAQENSIGDGDGNLTPPVPRIGRHATTSNNGLRGFIQEFFVYSSLANNAQRIIINNYLSAKYDMPLGVNDLYTMDNGANGDYDFDVAGIGQASDGSFHKDAQGSGLVRMSLPSSISDNEFLIWGHEGTAISAVNTTDVDGTIIEARLERVWRVNHVGNLGTVRLTFDGRDLPPSIVGSDIRLLITRDDALFIDNDVTPQAGSYNIDSQLITFSNVSFQDGDYFTLGTIDNTNSPLPVSLVNFAATPLPARVLLQWTTASELNNDFFTIERSTDAEQWVEVNAIEGAGTTKKTSDYSTYDERPLFGKSYYRLKQTDFDGAFTYSSIVSVHYDMKWQLKVVPNPSTNRFTILGARLKPVQVRLYNQIGQPMPVVLEYGNGETILQASHLAAGIYILKVDTGQSLSTIRLVKQ